MHRTRNAAYGQPYRGFESLPLRQSLLELDSLDPSGARSTARIWRFFAWTSVLVAGEPGPNRSLMPLFLQTSVLVLGSTEVARRAKMRISNIASSNPSHSPKGAVGAIVTWARRGRGG